MKGRLRIGRFGARARRTPRRNGAARADSPARPPAQLPLASEKLHGSQAILDMTQRLAHLGGFRFSVPGGQTEWSEETFRITGLDPVRGAPPVREYQRLIHPDDLERVQAAVAAGLRFREPYDVEYRLRTPAGKIKYVRSTGCPQMDARGRVVAVCGSIRDVTRSRHASEQLRELSRRVVQAHEAERRRLARELHDGVNQLLSSAKFRLDAIAEAEVREGSAPRREVEAARELLESAIGEIRLISQNLRPALLDDFGLAAALRSLCKQFSGNSGLRVDFSCDELPGALSQEAELALYRIAQEALNNVEKHAHARRVEVALQTDSHGLVLHVRDDGAGFETSSNHEDGSAGHGWGLLNMRERAGFVGGRMEIDSRPGHGCHLVVRMNFSSLSSRESQ